MILNFTFMMTAQVKCCAAPLLQQGRAAGALGLPVEQSMPGDCYMWGSSGRAAAGGSSSNFVTASRSGAMDRADSGASAPSLASAATSWHSSAAPVLLDGTIHLDVASVSVTSKALYDRNELDAVLTSLSEGLHDTR